MRYQPALLPVAAVLFIFLALLFLALPASQKAYPSHFTVNGREYAITKVESNLPGWEQGLMNTTNVTNSTFYLFAFPNSSIYPFWMKDTYVPLDIIWINNSRVVYLVTAYPCSDYNASQSACPIYTSAAPADYVIEARSGFAMSNNVTAGTRVSLSSN